MLDVCFEIQNQRTLKMASKSKYWGEIDDTPYATYSPDSSVNADVTADIERSMGRFCLAEFDIESEPNTTYSDVIELNPPDPLILYAIALHKYTNDMTEMIRVAELAIESHLIPPPDAAPPLPEMPEIQRKHVRNNLNFIPKDYTPFTEGEDVKQPELNSEIVKDVISKCVATLLAHIGYETTHQSVLDFLTDVLMDFLKKITYKLKVAAEDDAKGQLCGFPNIIERVLVEIGFGGVRGLHDYYQCRVINYVYVLQKRCKDLSQHYKSLLEGLSSETKYEINEEPNFSIISVKQEVSDVIDVDNQQIQLALDGEVGFSSLDAGFQLLSSLEAGTNTQGLGENEEESSITISPGVVTVSEADLTSTLSPYSKRKRTK